MRCAALSSRWSSRSSDNAKMRPRLGPPRHAPRRRSPSNLSQGVACRESESETVKSGVGCDVRRLNDQRAALGVVCTGRTPTDDPGAGTSVTLRRRAVHGQRGAKVRSDVDSERLEAIRTALGCLRWTGRASVEASWSIAHRMRRGLPEPVGAMTSVLSGRRRWRQVPTRGSGFGEGAANHSRVSELEAPKRVGGHLYGANRH